MSKAQHINKEKIARSFSKGKATYDTHARIQRRVSEKLVEKIRAYRDISFSRVLEIGCCTGTLTELLVRSFKVDKLFLNDLVEEFYDDVQSRLSPSEAGVLKPMFGDIEQLSLPNNLDLVVSSATFQWLEDLPALFASIAESLSPSGYLAFSIFGPGTLTEFREVTGIGLDYRPIGAVLDILAEKFIIEEEESRKDQLFFATPREILKHLQATGVGGVQEYTWTPGALRTFEKEYYEKFGDSSGVPVTYMSSYIVASKRG